MEGPPPSSSTQQLEQFFIFLPQLAPPSPSPSSAASVSSSHLPNNAWIEDPSRVLRLMMGTIASCNEAKVLVKELHNWPLPPGWERCLDLKSGQVFIKKPDFTSSGAKFNLPALTSTASRSYIATVQDNTLPSPALQEHAGVLAGDCGLHLDLDLRLTSNQSASVGNTRTAAAVWRKQDWESWQMGSCGERRRNVVVVVKGSSCCCCEEEEGASSLLSMATAVCPNCLMYVLLRKSRPRCPKCSSHIPLASINNNKRQRLDSVACPAVVVLDPPALPLSTSPL